MKKFCQVFTIFDRIKISKHNINTNITMQKIRASKEFLFAKKYLFDRVQIEQITGLTRNEQLYLSNNLKIIEPIISIHGNGSYFSFKQIQEFKIIKKMNEEFNIKKSNLKRAKDIIQQIDETKDLTDKSIIYAYGKLYFIDTDNVDKKIIELTNKNNNQETFLGKIVLSELEKQIDDIAKKILNFADYKVKKSYTSNLRIA